MGYESNGLKLFIEVFFESELKLEIHPSLFIKKKSLNVKGSSMFLQKILLQMTKPNAKECKYLFRYGTAENFIR